MIGTDKKKTPLLWMYREVRSLLYEGAICEQINVGNAPRKAFIRSVDKNEKLRSSFREEEESLTRIAGLEKNNKEVFNCFCSPPRIISSGQHDLLPQRWQDSIN
jgi:hypothetical protein